MTPLDLATAASGRTMYRVVTARGVPLAGVPVTDDLRRARDQAKALAERYPGCWVEAVEVVVRRRRVYKPRPAPAQRFSFEPATAQ